MKGRPRSVENKVALHISKFLATLDLEPVERIPVLGRTGPDIDVWPGLQVAVDVKSRKACPKSYKLYGPHLQTWGHEVDNEEIYYIGCRLGDLSMLFDVENIVMHMVRPASKVVSGWMGHMSEWTLEQEVNGYFEDFIVPALVLHWPSTPVKNSTFLIYEHDRSLLDARRKWIDNLRHGASNNQRDDGCPDWAEG